MTRIQYKDFNFSQELCDKVNTALAINEDASVQVTINYEDRYNFELIFNNYLENKEATLYLNDEELSSNIYAEIDLVALEDLMREFILSEKQVLNNFHDMLCGAYGDSINGTIQVAFTQISPNQLKDIAPHAYHDALNSYKTSYLKIEENKYILVD